MAVELHIGNKNYSSWSLRAWLLLMEAGIDFVEHRVPLRTATSAEVLRRLTPAGRVPVLTVDGERIWDSLAIAETVAERWPEKRLWPEHWAARAHARAVCAEMHSEFRALRSSMPMNCRAMGRRVPLGAALTADIDRVFAIWTDCAEQYADRGAWLFGEFSVADAMYAPIVLRFRTYGINLPEAASGYPARLLDSPALQQWLLDAESETEVIDEEEVGQ